MSGASDHDGLAAEFVLGTLEGAERAEAERLLAEDPAFRASVEAWQRRLAPLARLTEAVPPPADLWPRITAALWGHETAPAAAVPTEAGPITAGPTPATSQRVLRWWQFGTVGALALAAAFAGVAFLRGPTPPTPQDVAVLTPGGVVPVVVAVAAPHGELVVRPSGVLHVPAGRDLELWALAPGATTPRPLGVLPSEGRRLPASVTPGTRILISLEPKGGSPTNLPTGPVTYGGVLERYGG